jgi:hypothetical protein
MKLQRAADGVAGTGTREACRVACRGQRTALRTALRTARRSRAGWAVAAALFALATSAGGAQAQFMSRGTKFSGAIGISAPIGDLDKRAGTGFGGAVRTESPLGSEDWSVRADFSFDRFAGKAGVESYQFFTVATNLVHRSNARLYEFAGFGIYTMKTAIAANNNRSESAFGFQGGVGLNLSTKGLKTFVELGIADVLTTGRSSAWFPVRFGIRI